VAVGENTSVAQLDINKEFVEPFEQQTQRLQRLMAVAVGRSEPFTNIVVPKYSWPPNTTNCLAYLAQ
jgi:hypothetical protein